MSIAAVVLVLCTAGFAMCGAEAMHRVNKAIPTSSVRFTDVLLWVLSIYMGGFTMAFAVQVWMQ